MNSVLANILESRTVTDGAEVLPLHSAISPEEGELLQRVVRAANPSTSIEVGMAYGISTLYICEALKELGGQRRHIVSDPFQTSQWRRIGLRNIQEAGFDGLVDFFEEGSEVVQPRLMSSGVCIRMALIDGWHTFDAAMMEFFFLNRMLDVGGIIVLDDMLYPAPERVMRYILTYPCYRLFGFEPKPTGTLGKTRKVFRKNRLVDHFVSHELLYPAWDLGIDSSAVAVQKISEDKRNWDWYAKF